MTKYLLIATAFVSASALACSGGYKSASTLEKSSSLQASAQTQSSQADQMNRQLQQAPTATVYPSQSTTTK